MAHELIYMGEFPHLDAHYDPYDEGHTRGHCSHFEELYDQSIEDEKSVSEKKLIEAEKERFLKMVENSGEVFLHWFQSEKGA